MTDQEARNSIHFHLSMMLNILVMLYVLTFIPNKLCAQQSEPIQYYATIWVDPVNGDDNNSGSGKNNAKATLQAGIDAAYQLIQGIPDPGRGLVKCLPGVNIIGINNALILRDRVDLKGYGRGQSIIMRDKDSSLVECLIMGPLEVSNPNLRSQISGFTIMKNPESGSNPCWVGLKFEIESFMGMPTTGVHLDISIKNNSIYNFAHEGILVDMANGHSLNDGFSCEYKVDIIDNTISHCGYEGIKITNYWDPQVGSDPKDYITISNNTITYNGYSGISYSEEFSEMADASNLNQLLILRNNISRNGNDYDSFNNGIDLDLRGCESHICDNFITYNGKDNSSGNEGAGIFIRSPHASGGHTNHSKHNLLFDSVAKNYWRGVVFQDPDVYQFIRNTISFQPETSTIDMVNVKEAGITHSTFRTYSPGSGGFTKSPNPSMNIYYLDKDQLAFVQDYFPPNHPAQVFKMYGDLHLRLDSVLRDTSTYPGTWDGFDYQYARPDYDGVDRPLDTSPMLGADDWAENGYLYIYSLDDRNKSPRPIVFLGPSNYKVHLNLRFYEDRPDGTWYDIRPFTENSAIDPDLLNGEGKYPMVYFMTVANYPSYYPDPWGALDYDSAQPDYPWYLGMYSLHNEADEAIYTLGSMGVFTRGLNFDCHDGVPDLDRETYMLGYMVEVKGSIEGRGDTNQFSIQLGVPYLY